MPANSLILAFSTPPLPTELVQMPIMNHLVATAFSLCCKTAVPWANTTPCSQVRRNTSPQAMYFTIITRNFILSHNDAKLSQFTSPFKWLTSCSYAMLQHCVFRVCEIPNSQFSVASTTPLFLYLLMLLQITWPLNHLQLPKGWDNSLFSCSPTFFWPAKSFPTLLTLVKCS